MAPICTAGFTDSHWMRVAFGTVAYGFFPSRLRPRDRGAADPLRRRARAGRRPRARCATTCASRRAPSAVRCGRCWSCTTRRARSRRSRSTSLPRDSGGAATSSPTSTSATACRPLCAAARRPAPPEPCPLPLLACRIRRRGRGAGTVAGAPRVGEWERTWDDDGYAAAIEAVRAAIARGDVYQVNLVQHLSAPFGGDPAGARGRARAACGRCSRGRSSATAGRSCRPRRSASSPAAGGVLQTMPIKGTRPAGEDVDDPKDAAEHVMIVDLERNDLARVCEPGSIRWPRADGAARARGRDASRLDGRGPAARGRDARRDSRARRSPAAR